MGYLRIITFSYKMSKDEDHDLIDDVGAWGANAGVNLNITRLKIKRCANDYLRHCVTWCLRELNESITNSQKLFINSC